MVMVKLKEDTFKSFKSFFNKNMPPKNDKYYNKLNRKKDFPGNKNDFQIDVFIYTCYREDRQGSIHL